MKRFREVESLVKNGGEGRDVRDLIRGARILVLNRGIAAVRAIPTIKKMGAKAIIIANDGDIARNAMPVRMADEVVKIGQHPAYYSNLDVLRKAILESRADALIPMWGFVSENPALPAFCEQEGVIFVGPSAKAMSLSGDKLAYKQKCLELGIETSIFADAPTMDAAKKWLGENGVPAILKGKYTGGGKGIRKIFEIGQLEAMFSQASSEARQNCGNDELFIEKLVMNARHIEIQVIGDRYGNYFAFPERDCSLQRKNQKIAEVSPSPWKEMTQERREKLQQSAIKFFSAIGYHGAGTKEYWCNNQDNAGELNARLQVEAGISEMIMEFYRGGEKITLDLVEHMILVSFGGKLELDEKNCKQRKNYTAIQCRINAEDPRCDFHADFGQIQYHGYGAQDSRHVRLLTSMESGDRLSPNYDSSIGLLMVGALGGWAGAHEKMAGVLNQYNIFGVATTIPFHRRLLNDPTIADGNFDLSFIGANVGRLADYPLVQHPEAWRLGSFVAKLSALGYNPELKLGMYTNVTMPYFQAPTIAVPKFEVVERSYPDIDKVGAVEYIDTIRQLRKQGIVSIMDTIRDGFQSDFNNMQSGWLDSQVAPIMDECGYVGIENFGGAHYHVSLIALKQMPWSVSRHWKKLAPKTPSASLVRCVVGNGYAPLPENVLVEGSRLNHESIDWMQDFDFNSVENLALTAALYAKNPSRIYELNLSLTPPSTGQGFSVDYQMQQVAAGIEIIKKVNGVNEEEAIKRFITRGKDMAGLFDPKQVFDLFSAIKKTWPELVLRYHCHNTTGRGIEMAVAAARAGVEIIDTVNDGMARFYGQPPVLAVVAALQDEGLKTPLNLEAVRAAKAVFTQVMPFWDRWCGTAIKGPNYDVKRSLQAGGASSSF